MIAVLLRGALVRIAVRSAKLIVAILLGALLSMAWGGCVANLAITTLVVQPGGSARLAAPSAASSVSATGNIAGTDIGLDGAVSDVQRFLLARSAGWSVDDAITATAISIDENRTGDPSAEGHNRDGSIDLGLWQINSGVPVGVAWARFGGKASLVVAQNNANAAHTMWSERGFEPWTTFRDGSYRLFLARAQAAAAASAPAAGPTYAFPLPGWTGAINLHWNVAKGGSDLFAPSGQLIVSVSSGTVQEAGFERIGGNNVLIKGGDGLLYYYAHFRDRPMVAGGQPITAGTPIGLVGNTGDADRGLPHLHIGIGYSILLGADAYGGTGSGFDAVTFLRQLYAAGRN